MTTINLFRHAADADDYPAESIVFDVGDAADDMYAVVEGEVEIRHGVNVLETIGPGGIFGEMALIEKGPRSATAVASTACRLVSIDERRFTFLVQQTPLFSIQVMKIMAARLRRLTEQKFS